MPDQSPTHTIELVQRHWLIYVMTLGFLPFAIKDALRTANRTLGPLERLGNQLDRYRSTGQFTPVVCRDGDFLSDLISAINEALSARVNAASGDSQVPAEASSGQPA